MKLNYNIWIKIIFIAIIFNETGCADSSSVYIEKNSTTISQTSGINSSTKIISTPDGQKVISRSGNNTNISIQSSGSLKNKKNNRAKNLADDFPQDCIDNKYSNKSSKTNARIRSKADCDALDTLEEDDLPTAEEFKDRMRSRMRPVFPR